jgi:hypothetical protein
VQKVSRNEGGERKALEKETKLKGISSVGWQSVATSWDFAENWNKVIIVAVMQAVSTAKQRQQTWLDFVSFQATLSTIRCINVCLQLVNCSIQIL